jgi:hypothetical protein
MKAVGQASLQRYLLFARSQELARKNGFGTVTVREEEEGSVGVVAVGGQWTWFG